MGTHLAAARTRPNSRRPDARRPLPWPRHPEAPKRQSPPSRRGPHVSAATHPWPGRDCGRAPLKAARLLPSSSSSSLARRRRGGGDSGGTRAPVSLSSAQAWGSVAPGGGACGGWRGGSSRPGTRGAGAQAAGCGQAGSRARGLLQRAPWLRRGRHHRRGSLVARSLQECGRRRGDGRRGGCRTAEEGRG